jgi:hypothetical protein
MKRTLLAALIILVPCAPLHAQEQTVENAQKFLSIVLPGNGFTSGRMATLFKPKPGETMVRSKFDGVGKITTADSPARCRTAIMFDVSGITVSLRRYVNRFDYTGWTAWESIGPPGAGDLGQSQYFVPGVGGNPAGFAWADVQEVKVSGSDTDVLLMLKGDTEYTRLHLGAKDLATRVVYAMEFLRMQCDAAAGTGF